VYWGHDLDLSGSRDVIGHVTIGLGMGHFLLVVLWTQVSMSNGFRDIPPQTSCAHSHNAKSSLGMRVSRDMYPLCKFYIGGTCHVLSRMRNDDLALCLWAHDVWGTIYQNPLEIETWVQWTTNRKWPIGVRMIT